jgi:subtilisin family serine protease
MHLLSTKKIKFLILCFLALFLFPACSEKTETTEEIALLNFEYGLMDVEPLGNSNGQSPSLAYNFVPNLSQTNILDIFKDKKELVVRLKNDKNPSSLDDVFLLKLRTNTDLKEIAEKYKSIDIVSYAEPNFTIELSDYDEIKVADTSEEDEPVPNSNIVVAVIDSGVDINHKDLKDRIVTGYNFVDSNEDISDDYGHGTHVAGIVASNSSAKIMPIKFTDGKIGKMSDLAKAIKFAVNNNADIINLSLGLKEKSSLLSESIDYAFKNDIPVVAAAGNYNSSKKYYPAAYGKVIAVTGLKNDGTKLPQSNYGTWVDYSVKAQDILSTTPGDNYGYATGTSQAAPFITAKIAWILENKKDSNIRFILSELDKISTSLNTGKFALLLGKFLAE